MIDVEKLVNLYSRERLLSENRRIIIDRYHAVCRSQPSKELVKSLQVEVADLTRKLAASEAHKIDLERSLESARRAYEDEQSDAKATREKFREMHLLLQALALDLGLTDPSPCAPLDLLKTIRKCVSAKVDEIEVQTREARELKAKLTDCKARCEKLTEDIANAASKIAALEKCQSKLRDELQIELEANEKFKGQVEEYHASEAFFKAQLDAIGFKLQEAVADSDARIFKMENEREADVQAWDTERARLICQLEATQQELELARSRSEEDLSMIEFQHQRALEQKDSMIRCLENAIASKDASVSELEERLEHECNRLRRMHAEMNEKRDHIIEEKEKALQSATAQVRELTTSLKYANEKLQCCLASEATDRPLLDRMLQCVDQTGVDGEDPTQYSSGSPTRVTDCMAMLQREIRHINANRPSLDSVQQSSQASSASSSMQSIVSSPQQFDRQKEDYDEADSVPNGNDSATTDGPTSVGTHNAESDSPANPSESTILTNSLTVRDSPRPMRKARLKTRPPRPDRQGKGDTLGSRPRIDSDNDTVRRTPVSSRAKRRRMVEPCAAVEQEIVGKDNMLSSTPKSKHKSKNR